MNIDSEEFRLNLKYYREQKGWSQSQLAVQADRSNGQIGNIESGKAFPFFELIYRLAGALDIHPADLFLRKASVSKEKLNHAISTIMQEKIPKLIEEELASI